jgi:hypothetical protein
MARPDPEVPLYDNLKKKSIRRVQALAIGNRLNCGVSIYDPMRTKPLQASPSYLTRKRSLKESIIGSQLQLNWVVGLSDLDVDKQEWLSVLN